MKPSAALLALTLVVLGPARAAAQASDTSRLFFGPTGRMLEPGQGYVAFDGVFLATAQVGVTPYFSIGGGTPVVWFGRARPFWITPKVRIYKGDRTSVAAGVMNLFLPGVGRLGMAYGVGTIGTLEASMTIGGGVLYANASDEDRRDGDFAATPVAVIGGERRFHPLVSFLTENYVGLHGGLLTNGVRWRLDAWQINLGGTLAFGRDFVFPGLYFGVARKFGGSLVKS
jgi:hypothetical protein